MEIGGWRIPCRPDALASEQYSSSSPFELFLLFIFVVRDETGTREFLEICESTSLDDFLVEFFVGAEADDDQQLDAGSGPRTFPFTPAPLEFDVNLSTRSIVARVSAVSASTLFNTSEFSSPPIGLLWENERKKTHTLFRVSLLREFDTQNCETASRSLVFFFFFSHAIFLSLFLVLLSQSDFI